MKKIYSFRESKSNSFHESIKINKNNNLGIREESISLCLKNKVELPIIQRYHLTADEDIERKASNLAYFLNIPIKGNEV